MSIKGTASFNIIFGLKFCYEVVYPADHDLHFFNFFRFFKTFLNNIYKNPAKTQTYSVFI